MTNDEAIQAAEKHLDHLNYSLEMSPAIYDNAGLQAIYQKQVDWLAPLLRIAKGKCPIHAELAVIEDDLFDEVTTECANCGASNTCDADRYVRPKYCRECGAIFD